MPRTQTRMASYGGSRELDSRSESHWQQRTDIFPQNKAEEFDRFPMITADALRSRKERPKRVKMLTRDFIDGTVYPWPLRELN